MALRGGLLLHAVVVREQVAEAEAAELLAAVLLAEGVVEAEEVAQGTLETLEMQVILEQTPHTTVFLLPGVQTTPLPLVLAVL